MRKLLNRKMNRLLLIQYHNHIVGKKGSVSNVKRKQKYYDNERSG